LFKEEDVMLKLKRAYERASREDGRRILVERLWPRGIRKASLQLDAWLKEVAPTAALRQWFSHDPKKWDEFQRRYRAELEQHPEVCDPILKAARRGTVTLVYSSHDSEHNNAVALRDYLERRLGGKHRSAEHKSAA
jgi:uncharacterized protein YeaO (DUF488 family)